ncbi:hypothetical protein FRC12_006064 [Ceratobasidium sp. 428]|nr:hypothetical protein FRC12_006064 [Ceratobasidium sp. 428]
MWAEVKRMRKDWALIAVYVAILCKDGFRVVRRQVRGVWEIPRGMTNHRRPKSESNPKPKPKPRRYPRVHLLGRGQSSVQVTSTSTQIPINTTLATSFTPANSRFPKPPYLSTKYARFIPSHAFTQSSPDSYVLTRSVELFGLPGETDWIAKMKERAAAVSVRDKVTGLLSRLEWMDAGVRSLKNAAWAEHLAAMQNPRLERELEQDVDLPAWPSAEPAPESLNLKPSLSWSMSGERDRPSSYYTSSPHAPAYTFGNHNFPRPKRIIRLRPYDKSLVLVFASPTARRAIIAAYAQWIRKELRTAFRDRDNQEKIPNEGRGVWPPIDQDEIGGLRRGDSNYHTMLEVIEWAGRVGWRPAFRIQPFQGARRWGDEWHPRGRWSSSQARREEE